MTDAERMHEALRTAFERICAPLDDARFERRHGYDFLAVQPIPIALFNGVWPLDDAAAPVLSAALAELDELGLPSSVQVRSGQTPQSETEAKRVGLVKETQMPGMVAREQDLPAGAPAGLEVTRVAGGADLDEAMTTAATGFGAPTSLMAPLYTNEVLALDGLSCYLGRASGRAVSTSIGFGVDSTVGIFNVATLPDQRNQGYGAALTAAAARGGFADGAELAWLQSSALGLSVYRGLGFREVETYLLLTR
jgi:ribosomal protein S18 acetylase RimI-like enzyme